MHKVPSQTDSQQGNSFTLQLFQRTLEETLASFQKSIHDDMRNLHIEILRQFHMQEVYIRLLVVCPFFLLIISLIFETQPADGDVQYHGIDIGKPG